MRVIVCANESRKAEFLKKVNGTHTYQFLESFSELLKQQADIYFILTEDWEIQDLLQLPAKPVFLNSVVKTLGLLKLPKHFCRMNGWDTFINRGSWEISGDAVMAQQVLDTLEFKYSLVADEPGFVAARIVSRIINEAYFALGENISTKKEIDIAMKLGTNYPYGPFEWASLIGEHRIIELLSELKLSGTKYTLAPALEQAS